MSDDLFQRIADDAVEEIIGEALKRGCAVTARRAPFIVSDKLDLADTIERWLENHMDPPL